MATTAKKATQTKPAPANDTDAETKQRAENVAILRLLSDTPNVDVDLSEEDLPGGASICPVDGKCMIRIKKGASGAELHGYLTWALRSIIETACEKTKARLENRDNLARHLSDADYALREARRRVEDNMIAYREPTLLAGDPERIKALSDDDLMEWQQSARLELTEGALVVLEWVRTAQTCVDDIHVALGGKPVAKVNIDPETLALINDLKDYARINSRRRLALAVLYFEQAEDLEGRMVDLSEIVDDLRVALKREWQWVIREPFSPYMGHFSASNVCQWAPKLLLRCAQAAERELAAALAATHPTPQ